MAFSLQRQIEGLGKIDKGIVQGCYLHPVLTLDAHNGACHGVSALEFRIRPWLDDGLPYQQRKNARNKEFFEDKEGYRWRSSIEKALESLPPGPRKTVVADRESDIYAVLVGLGRDLGVDYVIRSRIDRTLAEGAKLSAFLEDQRILDEMGMELPAAEGRSARRARLQLRYAQVELKKTESLTKKVLPAYWKTWVVRVCEAAPTVPKGEQPVSWTLLTSHPVETVAAAWQIVSFYKQRWNIDRTADAADLSPAQEPLPEVRVEPIVGLREDAETDGGGPDGGCQSAATGAGQGRAHRSVTIGCLSRA